MALLTGRPRNEFCCCDMPKASLPSRGRARHAHDHGFGMQISASICAPGATDMHGVVVVT